MLELAPDARFVEAIRSRTPVLTGDARLPENLARASIQEAAAFVKEKNGLIHFESDLTTAPREFVGKCKVRLWADTIPIDYEPSSEIPPKETSVVVGLAETEMR